MVVTAALIGAGATAASAGASAKMSNKKMAANRDFQTMMSNTAYRRAVIDMKAAGLNPILAAGKGPGASTPSGGISATPDLGQVGQAGVNTGLAFKKLREEIKTMKSSREEIDARAENERFGRKYLLQEQGNAAHEQFRTQNLLNNAYEPSSKYEADFMRTPAGYAYWGAQKAKDLVNPLNRFNPGKGKK